MFDPNESLHFKDACILIYRLNCLFYEIYVPFQSVLIAFSLFYGNSLRNIKFLISAVCLQTFPDLHTLIPAGISQSIHTYISVALED